MNTMFTEFAGLPTHPLIVHSAVVLVPVAAILLLVVSLNSSLRAKLGGFPAALSVIALIATILTRSTGEAMLELIGLSEENPGPVTDHATFANYLAIAMIVMAVGHVAWWAVDSVKFGPRLENQSSWLKPIAIALAILGAVGALIFVVLTGHEGAALTWQDLPKA